MKIKRYSFFFFLLLSQLSAPVVLGAKLWSSTAPEGFSNPFQDDLHQFDDQMCDLMALEGFVEQSKLTLSALTSEKNPLAACVLQDKDVSESVFGSSAPGHERLMEIPGFLWGFCCSVVGMFLVYIAIDDPESKKKEGRQAIMGCAAGTLLWVGLYLYLVFWVSFQ
jgi:hypothetical protein